VDTLQGHLLIASPALFDPNFRRAVVLVAHHDVDGAIGLVLNRPAETKVSEVVPELEPLVAGEEEPVYVGGPVSPEALTVLAEFDDPSEAAAAIVGDVGFVQADSDFEALDTRRARVFAGYAGWSADQLEGELEEGSWIVERARPEDAFADDADALWGDVLRRKGGEYQLIATMPVDPSLN
jgi:putative transcriptional regulator